MGGPSTDLCSFAMLRSTLLTRQELSEAGLIGIPGPVQALRERLAWLPFAELPRDYVERSDGTPRASRRRIAAYKCEVGDKTVL